MQTALQRSVADSVLDRPLVVDLDGTLIKSDLRSSPFLHCSRHARYRP